MLLLSYLLVLPMIEQVFYWSMILILIVLLWTDFTVDGASMLYLDSKSIPDIYSILPMLIHQGQLFIEYAVC